MSLSYLFGIVNSSHGAPAKTQLSYGTHLSAVCHDFPYACLPSAGPDGPVLCLFEHRNTSSVPKAVYFLPVYTRISFLRMLLSLLRALPVWVQGSIVPGNFPLQMETWSLPHLHSPSL